MATPLPAEEVIAMLSRREFVAGAAATAAAPRAKQITLRDTIPAALFGKTGHRLPILACGGSAMVEKWALTTGVPMPSFDKRVAMIRHAYEMGLRYFDTSRNYGESESIMGEALKDVRSNVYLASKAGVRGDDKGFLTRGEVRASVEQSLQMLKTDYLDCIQVHGPLYEYLGYDRAMEVYEELAKLREEKVVRFIGVTGHNAFGLMHKLIDTKLFDQALMAYGYFPKGMDTILSNSNLQWRELCLARARELGMGVLAMKTMGSFMFSRNAVNIVPDFGEARLRALRQAALRWVLRDKQPIMLLVGVTLPEDIDENIRTLSGDLTFTPEDRKVLADFSVKALRNKTIQAMKTT
jgi:aryl-alcohol dehydrogenase-like predicted oxidoreductase